MPFDGLPEREDWRMEALRLVRARLDNGRRWGKAAWRVGDRVCLAQAVRDVVAGGGRQSAFFTLIVRAIRIDYPYRYVYGARVESSVRFNDHPYTTWLDIAWVLDRVEAIILSEPAPLTPTCDSGAMFRRALSTLSLALAPLV